MSASPISCKPQAVERVSVKNLTVAEFATCYEDKAVPLVLTDVDVSELASKWTLDFFRTSYGDVQVDYEASSRRSSATLAKAIADIQAGASGYVRDWRFRDAHPELLTDLPNLPYFQNDWLQYREDTKNVYNEIYIGATGTFTPIHYDIWGSHSWHLVISGQKKWMLCPPSTIKNNDALCRALNILDRDALFLDEFDSLDASEVDLRSGEMIFVPSTWYHRVENTALTISVTGNYINESTLKNSMVDLRAKFVMLFALLKARMEVSSKENLSVAQRARLRGAIAMCLELAESDRAFLLKCLQSVDSGT